MSYLGMEIGCKYVLTGPHGQRAVFNDATDEDYVGVLQADTSGLDSANVKEVLTPRRGTDGSIQTNNYYEARPVVLMGTIIASGVGDRATKIDKLLSASNAMTGDAVLLAEMENAPEGGVYLNVRRQSQVLIEGGYLKRFQVPLVAAYPFWRSATEHEQEAGEHATLATFNPGSVSQPAGVEPEFANHSWTEVENAGADDGNVATVSFGTKGLSELKSKYIDASNFGMPAIGPNDTLTTLTLYIHRWADFTSEGADEAKNNKLVIDNEEEVIEEIEDGTLYPNGDGKTAYGTYNLTPATYAEILDSESLRVRYSAGHYVSEAGGKHVEVDSIKFRATYIVGAEKTINNAGTGPAYPTITVTAGAAGSYIENVTSGQKLLLTGFPESDNMVIDTLAHTIKRSNAAEENLYKYLNYGESEWWSLAAGNNTIKFVGCCGTVSWQDAWA